MRTQRSRQRQRAAAGRSEAPAARWLASFTPLWIAFALSGVAGLVYETIWSRYLGLLLGHSAYGQVMVLVLFLGGMAGGALAVSRFGERLRRPLLLYVVTELLVGAMGFVFHSVYVALTTQAYGHWFPALGPGRIEVLKLALAAALLLPQSLLLGATFPLMSAGVVRRWPRRPGGMLALLYFSNSLGAAVGGLWSGFWLIARVGLPGTVMTAAGLNWVAALVVFLVVRASAPAPIEARPTSEPAGKAPVEPERTSSTLARILLTVAFGTAAASFIYEIAWIRMLSLVLGSATHSFELMVSAFILGLALGAFWVHRRADRFADPVQTLAATQWIMGALALATLPLYPASFQWVAGLVTGLRDQPRGYELFSITRYGICLALMLPATFCAGITLPLLTKILMRSPAGERAIGAVYGLNTLGSIVGAGLAALVLLPTLGLEKLLAAGALLDMALGALLYTQGREKARRLAWPALAGGMACAVGMVLLVRLEPLLLVSGVYRTGMLLDPTTTRMVFYRDGRTATVSVREQADGRVLSTNGKPDASLSKDWMQPVPPPPRPLAADESTQLLLPIVSLAHVPNATRAAVIGQGSGMTSHVLLGSPHIRRLTTVEIEPAIITASRQFLPANRRVFEDPRSSFVIDDARSYFAATNERFDLIVSEPSNPWVSGVSSLFTDEFYRLVRGKLSADGVLGQWIHLYSLDDDLALGVMAAIHRNFRDYRTYLVSGTDMLIVATNRAAGLTPDWSITSWPGFGRELSHTYPFAPRVFNALRVADRQALAPLLDGIAPNSDYFPTLDLRAERLRFQISSAAGWLQLHEDRFGLEALGDPVVDPPDDVHLPLPGITRVRSLIWIVTLHRALAGLPPPPDPPFDFGVRMTEALNRQRAVEASEASPGPPPDWRPWLLQALLAENERHTGTSGWSDEGFFQPLLAYAHTRRAPTPVTQALDWIHALDRRDFARAAALSDSLVPAVRSAEPWLAADILADGGVMAKLAIGDVEGARRLFLALAPLLRRPANDLRSRLVAARLGLARR